jgi:hypothetical protein
MADWEDYTRNAAEARKLAAETSPGWERDALLGLAARWERMAQRERTQPPIHGRPPQKRKRMANRSRAKRHKIEHPESYYPNPDALVEDRHLSLEDKKKALDVWEQDARQMLTASNEGMPGSEEGVNRSDDHGLGQVQHAKEKLGAKPHHKPSH